MTTKIIPYSKHHVTEEDIAAINEVLRHGYLSQGPRIQAFEEAFAAYIGSNYAVAVSSGTAALHVCAMALGVNAQSKVITSPISFMATANCIRYCGGSVTFADIDPQTAMLDIQKVREILQNSPKGTYQGIIPIDFAGYPVDMEAFRKLADEYNCWIIEDACHAPGGYFTNSQQEIVRCGSGRYADVAIYSFHPTKHVACGEGGMVTTNDKDLYHKMLMLRNHGIVKDPDQLQENHGGWYHEMQALGYNYRITDIQAALGTSQLKRVDEGNIRRREIAARYDLAFQGTPVKIISPPPGIGHAYHLYVIQVPNRKEVYDALRKVGIYVQIHYIPIHTQPDYQKLGYKKGSLPEAEKYYAHCISLPMFPTLDYVDQTYVIEQVLKQIAMPSNT